MEIEKKDLLTEKVIGAAMEVHRHLGPGLLESIYESCLEYELKVQGVHVERQFEIPVKYKKIALDQELRIDLLVEDEIVVEVKAINEISAIHQAQIMTYLRLRGGGRGLLINFNVPLLKQGISRYIV